ncbi:MAG: tetratricopeptide repeat protein [Saprospiraceae bacterium]|nr:MAG: tetratricopeptide repeat protein [Saprospiraceae bacterium]
MFAVLRKNNTSILFIATLLIASGCVTQKSKEDIGVIGKAYQNTTARYNGYYNAGLLLDESTLELEKQFQDNYSHLLPIYKYVEADNPKAVAENLDKAIEKVTVVVNLHRVSQWTDDCYLLLGQAQFLKQEYESAEETFEFMTAEFNPNAVAEREAKAKAKKNRKKAIKKGNSPRSASASASTGGDDEVKLTKKEREKLAKQKKKERDKERKQHNREVNKARKNGTKPPPRIKSETTQPGPEEQITTAGEALPEDNNAPPAPGSIRLGDLQPRMPEGDPEKYIIKHRPSYQEGLLWLARTYIERENWTNAERLLKQLETSAATYDDVRREAAKAKAHFYIRQKKYDQAVGPLETAISLTKDHYIKARLNFILGQIHQEAHRSQEAYAAFEQVLKNHPLYEMEFSARMNLATAGVNSGEESIKQLERMLKEEKNKEFQDQIYFALAEIALAKGDKKEGIKNLELSLRNSSRNMSQKAEAYLLLADLYFEDQLFVKAKLYYDSTLLVMPITDERYGRANRTASNLEGIAKNLQIIALQDSLLRISKMTGEERREMALKIKRDQDEKKLADLKKNAAKQNATGKGGTGPGFGNNPGGGKSNFWAYDDRDVKQGLREFRRKWGTRGLEDNWRRSNRQSISELSEALASENKAPAALTDEEVEEILKDVPTSDIEINAANNQIEAALIALGALYRDRLQNYPKAIESLNELLNRNPTTQYQLDALYYLYLSYNDMGDATNAQLYFDKIVNGYPETRYAKILKDPNYLKSFMDQEMKLTRYYDETYAAFEGRQYQEAYDRISKVSEKFGSTNKLQPRFALLSAMCTGNIQGKDTYVEALKEVIAKYPEAPEAARAKEILRLLGEKVGSGPGQQRDLPTEKGQVGAYKIFDDKLHYVIVVFHEDISLNDAKIAVSDYNDKYHKLQKLRMNNIYLGTGDDKLPILAIRRFRDKNEAMDYYNTVQKNKRDFLDETKFNYELLPIAQDNYRELLKSKTVDEYRVFFELNYLK